MRRRRLNWSPNDAMAMKARGYDDNVGGQIYELARVVGVRGGLDGIKS